MKAQRARSWRTAAAVLLLSHCASACGGRSSEDCEKIAAEIRSKAGSDSQGICSRTDEQIDQRFGPACAAPKKCNDEAN